MNAIPLAHAIEKLAKAVEQATPDDLVEYYAELYPAAVRRKADQTEGLAQELAEHIRTGIEPEEVADLWNVVFPDGSYFYYDEEEEGLCQRERGLRYAEY